MSPDRDATEELNEIKWFYWWLRVAHNIFSSSNVLLGGTVIAGVLWYYGITDITVVLWHCGITVIAVVSPCCLVMEENWQALSKSSQIKILLGENGSKWILLG